MTPGLIILVIPYCIPGRDDNSFSAPGRTVARPGDHADVESDAAAGVVQQALWLATTLGATLHVVRVIEVVPTIALGGSSMIIPSAERLVELAWLDLERLLPAQGQSEVDIRGHVTVGAPGQKILELAAELEADLLVVGTHNPGKVASVLFGTVATKLVREAACPVLVVRPTRYPHAPSAAGQPGPGDTRTPG